MSCAQTKIISRPTILLLLLDFVVCDAYISLYTTPRHTHHIYTYTVNTPPSLSFCQMILLKMFILFLGTKKIIHTSPIHFIHKHVVIVIVVVVVGSDSHVIGDEENPFCWYGILFFICTLNTSSRSSKIKHIRHDLKFDSCYKMTTSVCYVYQVVAAKEKKTATHFFLCSYF